MRLDFLKAGFRLRSSNYAGASQTDIGFDQVIIRAGR
jgi:hypothetical protein